MSSCRPGWPACRGPRRRPAAKARRRRGIKLPATPRPSPRRWSVSSRNSPHGARPRTGRMLLRNHALCKRSGPHVKTRYTPYAAIAPRPTSLLRVKFPAKVKPAKAPSVASMMATPSPIPAALMMRGAPPSETKHVYTAHGTPSARKTFCTFEPSALATAISVRPRRDSISEDMRFANDVPTAATVSPITALGMPKSIVSWSAVRHTAKEHTASHPIDSTNAASQRSSVSGVASLQSGTVASSASSKGVSVVPRRSVALLIGALHGALSAGLSPVLVHTKSVASATAVVTGTPHTVAHSAKPSSAPSALEPSPAEGAQRSQPRERSMPVDSFTASAYTAAIATSPTDSMRVT
mmetsp:Transcript_13914/g.36079  ORF Transcript_13914/g.36079 Transcript_13914/m.36079 type:complete len:352 (-) Transcript_13914:712-1767(-)